MARSLLNHLQGQTMTYFTFAPEILVELRAVGHISITDVWSSSQFVQIYFPLPYTWVFPVYHSPLVNFLNIGTRPFWAENG